MHYSDVLLLHLRFDSIEGRSMSVSRRERIPMVDRKIKESFLLRDYIVMHHSDGLHLRHLYYCGGATVFWLSRYDNMFKWISSKQRIDWKDWRWSECDFITKKDCSLENRQIEAFELKIGLNVSCRSLLIAHDFLTEEAQEIVARETYFSSHFLFWNQLFNFLAYSVATISLLSLAGNNQLSFSFLEFLPYYLGLNMMQPSTYHCQSIRLKLNTHSHVFC